MADRILRSLARDRIIRADIATRVLRGGRGSAGYAAETGLQFSFSGPILNGEPPMPGGMPNAGTFSLANSMVKCVAAASAPSVFIINLQQPDLSWALFATATFAPSGNTLVFAASADGPNPYPADAFFECLPPAETDATLAGALIVMGGP